MNSTAINLLAILANSYEEGRHARKTSRKKRRREAPATDDSDVVIMRDTADSDVEDISPGQFRRALQAREAAEERAHARPCGRAGGHAPEDDSSGTSDGESDSDGDGEAEVRVTGTFGKVATRDMPHSRPDCAVHRFTFGVDAKNGRHCAQCYCYVCDIKAFECQFWGTGAHDGDHANARPLAVWNRLRKAVRQGAAAGAATAAAVVTGIAAAAAVAGAKGGAKASAGKDPSGKKRRRDSASAGAKAPTPAPARRPAAGAAAPPQQPRPQLAAPAVPSPAAVLRERLQKAHHRAMDAGLSAHREYVKRQKERERLKQQQRALQQQLAQQQQQRRGSQHQAHRLARAVARPASSGVSDSASS